MEGRSGGGRTQCWHWTPSPEIEVTNLEMLRATNVAVSPCEIIFKGTQIHSNLQSPSCHR